jgi:hypothetical protein
MKYADEIGSGAMTYMPNFIKIGSGVQKFVWGIQRHFCFENKENMHPYNRIYTYICTYTVQSG